MSKLVYLLVLVLLILSQNTKAANYLNHTCEWVVKREYSGGFDVNVGNIWHKNYIKQYFDGDTIIGGVTYYHIWETGVDSIFEFFSNSFVLVNPVHVSQGGVRETADGKIYFHSNVSHIDHLLFDFNVNVGDVIPNWFSNDACNAPDTILSITSIPFGASTIKRYNISQYAGDMFEGIGCHGGFIESDSYCIDFEGYTSLICFHKDGNTLHLSQSEDCIDAFPTSIVHQNNKPDINFYPNPFNDYIQIEENIRNVKDIRLIDIYGKNITVNIEGNKVFIPNTPSGIYFLQVNGNSFKVFKQ